MDSLDNMDESEQINALLDFLTESKEFNTLINGFYKKEAITRLKATPTQKKIQDNIEKNRYILEDVTLTNSKTNVQGYLNKFRREV